MATNKGFKENVLRAVAMLGLIAILLLGAWGIIQLAFALPSFFSNIVGGIGGSFRGAPQKETITLSVPATVKSGEAFTLNWTHNNKDGAYAYGVVYNCTEGVSLQAPLPNGAWQQVPCNTPFNFVNAADKMQLVATSDSTKSLVLNVGATKLDSRVTTATSSVSTTVTPKAGSTATKKPTAATTKKPASSAQSNYVASGRTQNLYGLPDLAISITAAPQNARIGTRSSIQFAVQNVGTNVAAQGWSVNVMLPYQTIAGSNMPYTYSSGAQQKLYPGDKLVYTLAFDVQPSAPVSSYSQPFYQDYTYGYNYGNYGYGIAYPYDLNYQYIYYPGQYGGTGTQTLSFHVDAQNLVGESNESNNYASVSYQSNY